MIKKSIDEMKRTIIKTNTTGQKQNLIGNGSHNKISNQLKGGGVQPLRVLEIPNSNGILTTDENKMDKIARETWEKIFKGNIHGGEKMINEFIHLPSAFPPPSRGRCSEPTRNQVETNEPSN